MICGYLTWESRELAGIKRELLSIVFIIKLAALSFIYVAKAIWGFFIRVLMEEVRDSAIEVIKVRLYIYFCTCIAIIKDNRLANKLV